MAWPVGEIYDFQDDDPRGAPLQNAKHQSSVTRLWEILREGSSGK